MRKIIGSLFQSLDGVIQAPGGPEEDPAGFSYGGWVFPYFDQTLAEPMGRLLSGTYKLLLGRRTYEIFAAYWPHMATSRSARRSTPCAGMSSPRARRR